MAAISRAALTSTLEPMRTSRASKLALWGLQGSVSAVFLLTGSLKLWGVPMMVATFAHIGIGQWFRYATGAIEIVSALALLVPTTAGLATLALFGTMLGAIATHVLIVGSSPVPAMVMLGALSGIAWIRRHEVWDHIAGMLSHRS